MHQKNHSNKKPRAAHIELNGKLYDAVSGHLISHKVEEPKKVVDIKRQSLTRPAVHRKPERSQTLMRHAVKKPAIKAAVGRPQAAMDVVGVQITPSPPILTLPNESDASRTRRAKQVEKSSYVSRFGTINGQSRQFFDEVKKHIVPLPVVPAPTIASQPAAPKASVKHSPSEHLITKALKQSQAHNAKPAKTKKTRLHHKVGKKLGVSARVASLGMAGLAVLVLGAFFAYQNVPNFAVRYASAKAGLSARLPGYQPAGFAINDRIIYSPGTITLNFKANADNRAYSVTQRASNWSSEALVANYLDKVTSGGAKAQPYMDNGRTIFLYGDANATWVSDGVWYEITGDPSLTTDQLIKIATSI